MRHPFALVLAGLLLFGIAPLLWITFDVPPPGEWLSDGGPTTTATTATQKRSFADPEPTGMALAERTARRAAAREYLAFARILIRDGALSRSRDLLRRGFLMDPDSVELVDAFESIRGLADGARLPADDVIRSLMDQAFRRSWPPLVALYREFTARGLEAERDRIVRLFLAVLPVEPVKSELSLEWFEPYSRWMLPDQVARLATGAELIDGKWVPADEMRRANWDHRTWLNPWVLSDGVHVVRAPIDYRYAKEILEYAGAFRSFFLRTYRDDLWLVRPGAMLPIEVARNRREFEDRIRARFRSRDPGQFVEHRVREAARADAVYLLAKDDVECPVVIPLMSQSENKPAWEFWPVLRHDLTHQLVTTYLFHERPPVSQGWHRGLSESIAEHTEHYNLDERGWRFNPEEFGKTLRRCREEFEDLPQLVPVVERDILRERWTSPDEGGIRRMLACLAAFCLLGDNPDHRLVYLSLLETSEMQRLSKVRFRECVTYRQLLELSADWYDWMRSDEGLPGFTAE